MSEQASFTICMPHGAESVRTSGWGHLGTERATIAHESLIIVSPGIIHSSTYIDANWYIRNAIYTHCSIPFLFNLLSGRLLSQLCLPHSVALTVVEEAAEMSAL